MTKYHLVILDKLDSEKRRTESDAGLAPRHFFIALTDALGGTLHEPDPADAGSDDARPGLCHRILKTPPPLITLSRRVARACMDDDVVFCIGEAITLPIAYELKRLGKTTRLVSFGHNLYRPRITAANVLWGCRDRVDKFLVFTRKAEARNPKNRIYHEQTDDRMFSPGPGTDPGPAGAGGRPVIISVGLEQRDNQTLAAATRDMDVDVRITAFSRDARPNPRAIPDPMPDNMQSGFYAWPDLVTLYRQADLVVVPIVPNLYAAGITSILEAAAIGKPIVATRNPSLVDAVADPAIAAWVPPEDPAALKRMLTALLGDPEKLREMGATARRLQARHHSFSGRLDFVIAEIRDGLPSGGPQA